MVRSRKIKIALVGVIAAMVLLVPAVRHLRSGDGPLFTVTSPDHRSKLEFRSASKWQAWIHGSADLLGYVRLHRPDGKVIDSKVFELSGAGPAFWTDNGGVQVGTSAIYEPQNERWSVE